jgi:hypothetical protein
MQAQDGGPEWRLELNGETVATGGLLFHYNRPYGDIYMDVPESHRRRGFGAYIVQELKRAAYWCRTPTFSPARLLSSNRQPR